MLPRSTFLYFVYGGKRYAVHFRDCFECSRVCANCAYVIIAEFCLIVFCSARDIENLLRHISRTMRLEGVLTTFRYLVGDIVRSSTEKKVRRFNTGSRVAVMAYAKTFRYFSIGKNPGIAMHKETSAVDTKVCISGSLVDRSGPNSASGWGKKITVLLKALRDWYTFSTHDASTVAIEVCRLVLLWQNGASIRLSRQLENNT